MDDRERIVRLETQFENLIQETRGNSQAIGGLTDAITELRITLGKSSGAVKTAFVVASAGTVLAAGFWSIFEFLYNVWHK